MVASPVAPKTPVVAAPSAPEIPQQLKKSEYKELRDTCNRSAGSGNPATLSVGFKKKSEDLRVVKGPSCETCQTKTGTRGLGGGAAPPSRRL